jgi:hypothetical protein
LHKNSNSYFFCPDALGNKQELLPKYFYHRSISENLCQVLKIYLLRVLPKKLLIACLSLAEYGSSFQVIVFKDLICFKRANIFWGADDL